METVGIILFVLVLALGVFSPFIGLPGTFIIVGDALIYALISRFQKVSLLFLVFLLGMAVGGEVLEFLTNIFGAKHYGASRLGLLGSFLGSIAGLLFGGVVIPVSGTFLGGLVGAFLGAVIFELFRANGPRKALNAGLGVFITRLVAISVKVFIGIIMAILVLSKVF